MENTALFIALGVVFFTVFWILNLSKSQSKPDKKDQEPEMIRLSPKAYDQILAKAPGGPFDRPEESLLVPLESNMQFDITARFVRIEGTFNGHVKASDQIQIGPEAKVEGIVESPRIHVEEEACFKAKKIMG